MIKISQKLLNNVESYCRSVLPEEACGVLIGAEDLDSNHYKMDEFIPVDNVAASPRTQFQINPTEWIPLVYACLDNKKRQILGIVHSHPKTAAIPSCEDQLSMWKSIPTYWIVSFSNDHPLTWAYRIKDDSSYEKMSINLI